MTGRPQVARAAGALSLVTVAGAGLVVPLLYAPGLASAFALPKEVALEIAGALGFLGLTMAAAARVGAPDAPAEPTAGPQAGSRSGAAMPAWWWLGAALVLGTTALSAALAARGPLGAPYALASLGRWAALFGVAAGACAVAGEPRGRATIAQVVTVAAVVVSVIGLAQHVDLFPFAIPVLSPPGATFGNRNIAAELIAVSLPYAFVAWLDAGARASRRAYAIALVVEAIYLAATRARGAAAGAVVGLALVGLLQRQRWSRRVLGAVIGVLAAAAIVALVPARATSSDASDSKRLAGAAAIVEGTFDRGSTAVRTRRGLWRRSLAMFATAPVAGIGPGNWPVLFPRFAEPGATDDGVLTPRLSPRQAHDDLLERLVETGVVGLGALVVFAIAAGRAARGRLRDGAAGLRGSAAAAVGSLVALLVAGITGFPLDMPATLAVAGLSLGVLSSGRAGQGTSDVRATRLPAIIVPPVLAVVAVAVAVAVVVLGLAIAGGERRLRGSYWLGAAERILWDDPEATGAPAALAALDRAAQASPRSYRASLRRAQALLRLRDGHGAARAAEAALREEPFEPNAWAALAAARRFAGDEPGARAAVDRSLELLHDNPFALSVKAHLAEGACARAEADATWAKIERIARPEWPDPGVSGAARTFLRERRPGAATTPRCTR